jgi:hypothetical protein
MKGRHLLLILDLDSHAKEPGWANLVQWVLAVVDFLCLLIFDLTLESIQRNV